MFPVFILMFIQIYNIGRCIMFKRGDDDDDDDCTTCGVAQTTTEAYNMLGKSTSFEIDIF